MAVPNEQKAHLITCDKDCYYQKQGYCALDEMTYLTNYAGGGCGYFTRTDPYADLPDDRDRL